MDIYTYKGSTIKTLNTVYVTKAISGKPKPQDDVAALKWYEIANPPLEDMAFTSQKKALKDLQKWYRKQN